LEANSRVGGRTLSIKVKGPNDVDDALDLGAHWVSTRQMHVMELIEKFGIGYYPQNTTGTKIMQVIS
jgi:monoamine oxidase